jgi:acyl carrier protein
MTGAALDLAGMQRLVLKVLAEQLDRPIEDSDADKSFIDLGLDSMDAMFLCGALEEQLNRSIDPVLVFEASSAVDFAQRVLAECQA